jgi:hypothetical protein
MNNNQKTELLEAAGNLIDEANRLLIMAGADFVVTVMEILPAPVVSGNVVAVDFRENR